MSADRPDDTVSYMVTTSCDDPDCPICSDDERDMGECPNARRIIVWHGNATAQELKWDADTPPNVFKFEAKGEGK